MRRWITPSQTGRINLSLSLLARVLPHCFPPVGESCFSLTKYPHSYLRPPFFIIRISLLLRCVRVCCVHHTTLRVLTARETFGQFVSLQYSSQLLVILVSRTSKSGSRPDSLYWHSVVSQGAQGACRSNYVLSNAKGRYWVLSSALRCKVAFRDCWPSRFSGTPLYEVEHRRAF